ncbi:hypothetical protein BH09MYX1_BH09MYX1_47620 [soil metagenome]
MQTVIACFAFGAGALIACSSASDPTEVATTPTSDAAIDTPSVDANAPTGSGTVVTPDTSDPDAHATFSAQCKPACAAGTACSFAFNGCVPTSTCNPSEAEPQCAAGVKGTYVVNGNDKANKLQKVALCVSQKITLYFFDLNGKLAYVLDDPLCHETVLNDHVPPGLYTLEAYDLHGARIVTSPDWDDVFEIKDP